MYTFWHYITLAVLRIHFCHYITLAVLCNVYIFVNLPFAVLWIHFCLSYLWDFMYTFLSILQSALNRAYGKFKRCDWNKVLCFKRRIVHMHHKCEHSHTHTTTCTTNTDAQILLSGWKWKDPFLSATRNLYKWHCNLVHGWMVYTELVLKWQHFTWH